MMHLGHMEVLSGTRLEAASIYEFDEIDRHARCTSVMQPSCVPGRFAVIRDFYVAWQNSLADLKSYGSSGSGFSG